MGNHAHYIGGWSSVININEVVNTNLDTDSSQASIAGKGVSSNSGHVLNFNCVISRHCQTMSERQAVLQQLANEKSELSAYAESLLAEHKAAPSPDSAPAPEG